MNEPLNFYDMLADCYDSWQYNNDPEEWADYLNKLIECYGPEKGDGEDNSRILVDLGCGTGKIACCMAKRGYDVIGIDSSSMMLNKAMDLCYEEQQRVLLLNQDITEYELYGTADVFVSLLDTINHLNGVDDLIKIFNSFKNYMNPQGIFIFDVATEKHFAETLNNNVFYDDEDDYTLLWINEYDKALGINNASITLFEKEENEKYSRLDGNIKEIYIKEEQIVSAAEKCGLKVLAILGDKSFDKPTPRDERVFFIVGKE